MLFYLQELQLYLQSNKPFKMEPLIYNNLLDSIFQNQHISEQILKELIEWHHGLDPSFNYTKSILNQYFMSNNQALFNTVKRINAIIVILQERKCPKSFIRALIATFKTNQNKISEILDYRLLAQKWTQVNVDYLQLYFQSFNITIDLRKNIQKPSKIRLTVAQIETRIKILVENKEYESAMNLVKLIEYPQNQVRFVLQTMATSKQASKAASLIKKHKIDVKLVPQVNQRLNKNSVRHFFKVQGWESAQQIFYENNEALAYMFEDLAFRNKNQQAISLWWRHPQIEKYLTKKEGLQFLQKLKMKSKAEIEVELVSNSLFIDYFGPQNPEKQLSLKEYNINEEDVKWVESKSPQILQLLQYLEKAEFMAIDTQSIVGKNKLQRKKNEPASIVQIAFKNKIFILDGNECNDQTLKNAIINYAKSKRPLIGHAIMNDVNTMLSSFGFDENQLRLITFDNIIDTCELFKGVFPKQKYSNLAHICKIVLHKQVCKKQTLTNWARRPLRKNQLHYAAMDAFCVIKIYQGLIDQVGENMLKYFLSQNV